MRVLLKRTRFNMLDHLRLELFVAALGDAGQRLALDAAAVMRWS